MATAFASRPAAAMTARVVVMMTPDEKRALVERARTLALTPSELVRRASQTYQPQIDDELLEAFVTQFAENNRAMHVTLSSALDRVDVTLAEIDALRAAR